jgi:hypothetical protein
VAAQLVASLVVLSSIELIGQPVSQSAIQCPHCGASQRGCRQTDIPAELTQKATNKF